MSRTIRILTLVSSLALVACDDRTTDTDAGAGLDGGGPGVDSGECEPQLAVLCVGDDVTVRDACTGASTVVETCAGACYRGGCVDCAPGAGRLCVGDELRDVDSCGVTGDLVETCADGCRAGACVGAECTPDADTVCVDDSVYSVDSCGNLQGALRLCADGCADGRCVGCTPDAFSVCYQGDIYGLDSCQALGDRVMDCPETCAFEGGTVQCVTGRTCTPNAGLTCFEGDIHHVDSCGGVQVDVQTDCPSGCDESGCLPCTPVAIGTTCAGGDVHQLIGGCPGVAPTVGAELEDCADGCSGGACVTGGCVPDAGTVCSGGNVHVIDSCGTVGAMIQACSSGCDRGACVSAPADAGTPPTDAGTPPGDTCSCVGSPDSYPPLSCTIGDLRCGGCLGFDDFCDDSEKCLAACPSEIPCVDGLIVVDDVTITFCGSCPDCDNPTLCDLACSSAP